MISLNASELACSTRIFYLLLNKEIHTSPETQGWAWLGRYFCFTLTCLYCGAGPCLEPLLS